MNIIQEESAARGKSSLCTRNGVAGAIVLQRAVADVKLEKGNISYRLITDPSAHTNTLEHNRQEYAEMKSNVNEHKVRKKLLFGF